MAARGGMNSHRHRTNAISSLALDEDARSPCSYELHLNRFVYSSCCCKEHQSNVSPVAPVDGWNTA
ncbi:hypothetical protein EJB05_40473 [Eragrostis curvula]|uniref:Uncharacterized protein n=1 Tax=Eragrostis curvula TaxID=38414 RepID=A0A5J9TQB3_9POAL|nr:hypothetical protein EJB05_40473 [Eragrostis curvula]